MIETLDCQETHNMLVLAALSYYRQAEALKLFRKAGSATAVIDAGCNVADIMPGCGAALANALKDTSQAKRRAESELEYCLRNGIEIICYGDERYPRRLAERDDAPLVMFYKGTADLNPRRVVSVVGTRHATAEGQDNIMRLMKSLAGMCPGLLVVSGLAYGVDISAHRAALDNRLDTVAVLAHGLDNLYPPAHRETANRMTEQGGLLTEYFTHTNADKLNFLQRNRIVAGMSDATIVVESASHGGALVTARLAGECDRAVFAFPGRATDKYSEGCNRLIRDGKARLITSGADFMDLMGWQSESVLAKARGVGIERSLFPEYTAEEQLVVNELEKDNDRHVNTLAAATSLPMGKLSSALFSLEMKGVIRCLAGGVYHIIGTK